MKALIVVDYQNDYVTGPMGHKYAKLIEDNICRRIDDTIDLKGDIFFLMDSRNAGDEAHGREGCCIRGSFGEEIHGRVGGYINKGYIIRKSTPGSEELFRRMGRYDEIELCGVEMDKDVLVNALIAQTANPKARVVVRQNCVASKDTTLGEEAMDILSSLGIKLI